MLFQRDIPKGNDEILRVEITEFRGQSYLNIRIWYTDKESGQYKPTQRGIAIRPELYSDLKSAVLEAGEELQKISGAS